MAFIKRSETKIVNAKVANAVIKCATCGKTFVGKKNDNKPCPHCQETCIITNERDSENTDPEQK